MKSRTCVECVLRISYIPAICKFIFGPMPRVNGGLNLRGIVRGNRPGAANNCRIAKSQNTVKCPNCELPFKNRWLVNKHLRNDCINYALPDLTEHLDKSKFEWEVVKSLSGCIVQLSAIPLKTSNNERMVIKMVKPYLKKILCGLLDANINVKWSYNLELEFAKDQPDGTTKFKTASFSNPMHAFENFKREDSESTYKAMYNTIQERVEKFSADSSGWVLDRVVKLGLSFVRVRLLSGGAPVELPPLLRSKHCLLNIQSDNCFIYSVLAALHHHEVADQNHKNRPNAYNQWLDEFPFPQNPIVSAADIGDFERGTDLAIYAHSVTGKGRVDCIRRPAVSRAIQHRRIHIVLFKKHWMAITNLSALYHNVNDSNQYANV